MALPRGVKGWSAVVSVVFPGHTHFLSLNENQQTTKRHAIIPSRVKVNLLVILISKMYKICNTCIKQVFYEN